MTAAITSDLEALHPDAFGWALHCCHGDHFLAEDVLQTAYVKLAQDRARFDGRSSLKSWWFGVIKLTSLEEVRRLRFRSSLIGKLLLGAAEPLRPVPTPAEAMEQDERCQQLRNCLRQLPARQSEVLHLVFYQDLTIADAAQVMKVSLGSARQHYERGKARLRDLLKPSQPAAIHE